ncbi:diacylglycerol kinase [Brumimicrobium salinarum]|uniref:Diacylglycerol kinase n=1 Tax=Brumimicrobium salinarum TaxID=2058658 RepID=A0A2I0R4Y5_9FLAO|nr:diacylglycerol kinase family protein [Brumimicrobium salinarum]PKR81652.1 diacylglycerol kinase [Brumimicrobium salinarum]
MKKHILFIINPISGVGKKNILPDLIAKYINQSLFEYEIVFTQHKGHAEELSAQAAEKNIDVVCVVGGDGSVHEAGKALIHKKTALAILATGSGNGVARHLKLPLNLKHAIKRINDFNVKKIDTVLLNNQPFIGVAGFGFDALIAEKFDQYHNRGLMSYVRLVLKEIRYFKGVNIQINQRKSTENILLCCIANTSQFGNGFTIAPNAKVNDGKFELIVIKSAHIFTLLPLFVLSIIGKLHWSKKVSIERFKEVNIQLKTLMCHLDGEPQEEIQENNQVRIQPQSLNVLV